MKMLRTKYCYVSGCNRKATIWEGTYLIKSRDKVLAGVCDEHTGMPVKTMFNMPKTIGIYNKSLELLNPTQP